MKFFESMTGKATAKGAEPWNEGFDMEKVKRGDAKIFQTVFTNQNATADCSKDVSSFISNVNKARQKQPKVNTGNVKELNDVLKQQKTVFPLPTKVPEQPNSTVGG